MKNYERYPNQIRPQTKEEYFEFWKDCPYVKDNTISENFRWQWCIIKYGQWWVGEMSKESLYKS
jgi:hypothetical protein